jgi:hypothetical protein
MGDVVRSVVVIALIILAVWGIGKFFTRNPDTPVKAIDYATIVQQARPVAGFDLLAPRSLPQGWIATSARFEAKKSWHLGVLTDDEDYIGLEQVTAGVDRAVDRFAEDSKAGGKADIAGDTWTVREGPDDRLTFVRRADGLTTLVNGTAPRRVIEDYVSSLSTS